MANETVINTQVNPSAATVINDELSSSQTVINPALNESTATVINTELEQSDISPLTKIGDKYRILNKLDVKSGEADLYVCEYKNKKYVAKIYRRERSIKKEVLDVIRNIHSPYVAGCFDTGEIDGHTYEIIPYYKNGSLQGKKVPFETLRDYYIPSLNEALRELHEKGLVHKDLKPSNIMINDDQKSVAIIDFGISSVLDTGSTMVVTNTGMTPIYSAPETYRNMFWDISDYYSMGVTLFELFTGKLPYSGLSQTEMERLASVTRIPLPDNMPRELKELILGLTYLDITNRNNKSNPNRRWSYDEVKKWLNGIKQVIPGEGVSENNIVPYLFQNQEFTSVPALVKALAEDWEEGKKHLFRGKLTRHFARFNPNLEEICRNAESKAARSVDNDDVIYWEALCKLDSRSKNFFWKNNFYYNLPAYGRELFENLTNPQKILYFSYADDIMKNNIVSRFCRLCEPENTDRIEAVKLMEEHYKKLVKQRNKEISLFRLSYYLSGQHPLRLNGKTYNTIQEFIAYVKELSNDVERSYQNIIELSKELCISPNELSAQFEAWLIANKQRDAIEKWKASLNVTEEEAV